MSDLYDDDRAMRAALESARQALAEDQAPFGAVVVKEGKLIAQAQNSVRRDVDPSAHAEINVLRQAAQALGSTELSGCTLYTSCEPCPMCLAAILWTRLDRVVFGATIDDAVAAGYAQLHIEARRMVELSGWTLRVDPGPFRAECAEVLRAWRRTDS